MKSKERKNEIFVSEFIDRYCLYEEQGNKLFNELKTCITENKKVRLNFTGTWLCSSDFLNSSIGKLLMYFDRKQINEYVSFICTDNNIRKCIALVILNSEKYYTDPIHRKRLDEAYAEYDKRYYNNSKNGEVINAEKKKRRVRKTKVEPI